MDGWIAGWARRLGVRLARQRAVRKQQGQLFGRTHFSTLISACENVDVPNVVDAEPKGLRRRRYLAESVERFILKAIRRLLFIGAGGKQSTVTVRRFDIMAHSVEVY